MAMLTRSSEYALQGLIHLAQQPKGSSVSRDAIARETGIPGKYLSKILSDLVRAGLLVSSRGPGGGFSFARSPNQITLHEAVTPFEPPPARRCPFGNIECSDENPCGGHSRWKKVIEAEESFLRETTLSEIATPASVAKPTAPKGRSRR